MGGLCTLFRRSFRDSIHVRLPVLRGPSHSAGVDWTSLKELVLGTEPGRKLLAPPV